MANCSVLFLKWYFSTYKMCKEGWFSQIQLLILYTRLSIGATCISVFGPVVPLWQRHTALHTGHIHYPVRDQTGCAVAVIDLGVKGGLKMSYAQNREVMRIMKLLSIAYHELLELKESNN